MKTLVRHSVLSSRKFRAQRETPRESRMHRKQGVLKRLPTISEGKVRKKSKGKEKEGKADAQFGKNCEQTAAFLPAVTKTPREKANFILISLLPKG